MPERPLQLLDQLCFYGFTDADFALVHDGGADETIHGLRTRSIGATTFEPGGDEERVVTRLERVLSAFLGGGFHRPARPGVFRALCQAALCDVARTVDSLFRVLPKQWGLRGDPHLWAAMKANLTARPLPESAEALEELLREAFERLSGSPLSTPEPFYVAEYAHGGMSSGYIDPRFWRSTGLPLLLATFRGTAP